MLSIVFDCCNEIRREPLDVFNNFMKSQPNFNTQYPETIEINGNPYNTSAFLKEVDIAVRIARKSWQILQSTVLKDATISYNDLSTLREDVNKCLGLIIHCLKCCENDRVRERYVADTERQVKTFSPLVLPIYDLEKNIYLKLTGQSCNKNRCPIYQYFHTFQDVQYYLLLFYYVCGNTQQFESRLTLVIKDLVIFCENGYNQNNNKSPFVCECNKKFWLIIQLLCERVLGEDNFWTIFNKVVETFKSEYVVWILRHVGSLQAIDINGKYVGALNDRIKPNFTLLESALKEIVSKADFHSSILVTLKAVEPLVCDLWLKSGKIEIYQTLWHFYSKRLNISTRNGTNFTLTELVDLIDTILWTPKDCEHDFELFLAMLSAHLNEHPHHWPKMKGRIYSQLGPNKVRDFHNVGIFNVLLLFLSLTKVNFDEPTKKFLSFIENLPQEKKQSQLIWSFYTALVGRHIRENRDIEDILPLFIKMAEEASTDLKLFPLLKRFVSDFDSIMKFSTNIQLHQWLLINSWIHKYMTTCYYQDLITLLTILLNVIHRVSSEHLWCEWKTSFKNYVFPTLKYVAGSKSAPEMSGVLAGEIAILSPNLISEAFTFFTGENVPPKVSAGFLRVVLEKNTTVLSTQQESVALQTWVKFCLLTRDGYEEFTLRIVKLNMIPEVIKNVIIKAKDPLCAFIEHVGNNIKEYVQTTTMHKLCENLFGNVERCITQYFTQPDNEAKVLRIYTCLGLAFYKMGPLLYNRHKSNCPYARIINAVMLPAELLVGKPVNALILQSIKKTWHLFFEATVRLSSVNDAFLDRILREMVVRYVPHFSGADSPILKCLDNEVTAKVILEKMAMAFFKQLNKEAEPNIFKSLKLISDFVQSTTSAASLKLVVNKTLYGLFEIVMFHNYGNTALSTIKSITRSPLFPQVTSEFEETIITITEKHLAFNTPNYFQLIGNLAKLIPNNIKGLTPRIKQHISNVERMRGVGYDRSLRQSLERLEASLFQKS